MRQIDASICTLARYSHDLKYARGSWLVVNLRNFLSCVPAIFKFVPGNRNFGNLRVIKFDDVASRVSITKRHYLPWNKLMSATTHPRTLCGVHRRTQGTNRPSQETTSRNFSVKMNFEQKLHVSQTWSLLSSLLPSDSLPLIFCAKRFLLFCCANNCLATWMVIRPQPL